MWGKTEENLKMDFSQGFKLPNTRQVSEDPQRKGTVSLLFGHRQKIIINTQRGCIRYVDSTETKDTMDISCFRK